MSHASFVEDLLASNPLMRVRDPAKVEKLLLTLLAGGLDKLQVVADFDYTLTKTKNVEGVHLDCSWGVLENSRLMPKSYTVECNKLKEKYLPIELVRCKFLFCIYLLSKFITPFVFSKLPSTAEFQHCTLLPILLTIAPRRGDMQTRCC